MIRDKYEITYINTDLAQMEKIEKIVRLVDYYEQRKATYIGHSLFLTATAGVGIMSYKMIPAYFKGYVILISADCAFSLLALGMAALHSKAEKKYTNLLFETAEKFGTVKIKEKRINEA